MCPVREVLHSDTILLGLWKHECERVFADRLVDKTDKDWFSQVVQRVLEDRFSVSKALAGKSQDICKQRAHFVANASCAVLHFCEHLNCMSMPVQTAACISGC